MEIRSWTLKQILTVSVWFWCVCHTRSSRRQGCKIYSEWPGVYGTLSWNTEIILEIDLIFNACKFSNAHFWPHCMLLLSANKVVVSLRVSKGLVRKRFIHSRNEKEGGFSQSRTGANAFRADGGLSERLQEKPFPAYVFFSAQWKIKESHEEALHSRKTHQSWPLNSDGLLLLECTSWDVSEGDKTDAVPSNAGGPVLILQFICVFLQHFIDFDK